MIHECPPQTTIEKKNEISLTNGEMGLVAINPRMTIILLLLNNWKYIPRNNHANQEGRLLRDLRWTLRLLKLLHLLHRVTMSNHGHIQ